jgi:1-deoxy-D-xylulose 5-phosphate reductoisomerase
MTLISGVIGLPPSKASLLQTRHLRFANHHSSVKGGEK